MTLADRASAYAATFPNFPGSHLAVTPGRGCLQGIWTLGNDYRAKSTLYGAYPPSFLKRVAALFPDKRRVLHAFSGSLPAGPYVRLDRHPARVPDVLGDVCRPPFADASFDLVYADPPYSDADALIYGTPMINRRSALAGLARVVAPGGFVAWLDTQWPMHRKDVFLTVGHIALAEPQGEDEATSVEPPLFATVGLVGVIRSTNHRVRLLTILERSIYAVAD